MPGAPTIPVIDDTLTMAPPPAARISGMTARAQIQALPTLTRMTRSHSATGAVQAQNNPDQLVITSLYLGVTFTF